MGRGSPLNAGGRGGDPHRPLGTLRGMEAMCIVRFSFSTCVCVRACVRARVMRAPRVDLNSASTCVRVCATCFHVCVVLVRVRMCVLACSPSPPAGCVCSVCTSMYLSVCASMRVFRARVFCVPVRVSCERERVQGCAHLSTVPGSPSLPLPYKRRGYRDVTPRYSVRIRRYSIPWLSSALPVVCMT